MAVNYSGDMYPYRSAFSSPTLEWPYYNPPIYTQTYASNVTNPTAEALEEIARKLDKLIELLEKR
jgi:hypothetical protein